ncbi:LuxR C-terminal-related transcriptional regulator [Streptomyces sp. NPDC099088]|uniref:helix-turn-helix transcriptional regulator n=1 Tax=Streptomyces sp. NPDC099088 TaxID=3366101 RepID=UPI00381E31E8
MNPIVGRKAELAAWEKILAGSLDGVWLIAIAAEPGLGKTRILTEYRRSAEQAGLTVGFAQAAEGDSATPFAVLTEALDPIATRSAGDMNGQGSPLSSPLRLPESHQAPDASHPAELPRAGATHSVIGGLLEQFAVSSGMALLLDDLHWSDAQTIDFLAYLARRPVRGRVAMCVTYRPHQASNRLLTVIDALAKSGEARKITLGPLTEANIRSLDTRDTPDGELRRRYAASLGNPLYFGVLAAEAGDETHSHARAQIGTELESLPSFALQVAGGAAVLGTDFDPALLPAVLDLSDSEVGAGLDELVRRDIIRQSGTDRLTFRHEVVREAVYHSIGPAGRHTAHTRAARAMRTMGSPAELWAHHLTHTARIGDHVAIRVLLRAALAVRPRAPMAAAEWYSAALRLLPDGDADRARRARLTLAQAETLLEAGLLVQSRSAFSEAMALLRPHAHILRTRAVLGAARVAQYSGLYDEADAMLERELSSASTAHSPTLQVELAATRAAKGDFPAARESAESVAAAINSRRAVPSPSIHAVLAFSFTADGCLDEGLAHARAAGWAIDAMSDAELAVQLHALLWTVQADMCAGRYALALRRAARGSSLALATGSDYLRARLLTGQGAAARMLGALKESRSHLDEALGIAELSGTGHLVATILTELSSVADWQGDVTEASELAERAVVLAGGEGSWTAVRAGSALGYAQLAANQPRRCVALVTAAAGGADLPLIERPARALWYELLTRAALADDDADGARQWTDRALGSLCQSPSTAAAAFAALAESHTLLAAGDPRAAVVGAHTAVDGFKQAGNRMEGARARLALGRALAANDSRQSAIDELRIAKDDFARSGALRLEDEVTLELRRLGVKVPRTGGRGQSGSGLEALSRREREVAEHVARGLTNREVAAWMYLSEKTVERHLSSIFTKLGVRSRVAVALAFSPAQITQRDTTSSGGGALNAEF